MKKQRLKNQRLIRTILILILLFALVAGLFAAPFATRAAAEEPSDETVEATSKEEPSDTNDKPTSDTQEAVRLIALKGPTAMGAAAWINGDDAWLDVEAEILATPDLLPPIIAKGEYDLALMPGTLAATLYEKTDGDLRFMALSTLSVLHFVERGETVNGFADLSGKTIVLAGKGTTPDQLLLKLLAEAELEDVNVEYASEHQAVVQELAKDETKIGLLPEPFVTVALTNLEDLRVALPLADVWTEVLSEDGEVPAQIVQGVLVARRAWLEENPEVAAEALKAYKRSTQIALDTPEIAAEAIAALDLFPKPVAEQALPRAGLTAASDEEAIETFKNFLLSLDDDKLPEIDDAFFDNGPVIDEEPQAD